MDLTKFGDDRLRSAVEAAMSGARGGSLPTSERLRAGAEATLKSAEGDTATYFQSMLEIGYLVASADGFAAEERRALASLLERVTGNAVDHDTLELHFKDLDDAVEMLGRRERLRRAAEDFADPTGRHEALGFATVVAIADGKLAQPESKLLVELGGHFGFSEDETTNVVEGVVKQLRSELEG